MSSDFDAARDDAGPFAPLMTTSLQPIADDVATSIDALRARAESAATPLARAAAYFELGMLYEHSLGDEDAANKQYQTAFNEAPSFRAPLFSLIRNYERRRSTRNLERLYETEAQISDDAIEKASALVDRGVLVEDDLEDPTRAAMFYREALRIAPSSVIASLSLERTLRHAHHEEEADDLVVARLAHIHDDALFVALAAEASLCAERRGDDVQALHLVRLALAREAPGQGRLFRRAALLARRLGDVNALVDVLVLHGENELAGAQGDDAATVALSNDRAASCFCDAARYALAAQGQAERSLALYARAVALRPGDVSLRYERLLVADASNDFALVEDETAALLALEPPPSEIAALEFLRAEAALAIEDKQSARDLLARAITADPDAVGARVLLEDLDAEAGDDSRRLLALERVASDELRPRLARVEALLEMASVLLDERGEFKKALPYYERAAALALAPGRVWRELYLAAVRADDAEAMVQSIDGLLRTDLSPDLRSAWSYERWRLVRDVLHDEGRGIALLASAIEDSATRAWSLDIARIAAAEVADFGLLDRVHTLRAETAHEAGVRAAHSIAACRAMVRAGRTDAAIERLRDVLAETEGQLYARSLLAALLSRAGDVDGAKAIVESDSTPSADTPSVDEAFRAAAAAERRGDVAEAAALLERVASSHPDELSLWQALLRCAEKLGDEAMRARALLGIWQIESQEGSASSTALELAEHRLVEEDDAAQAASPLSAALDDADTGLFASLLALTELGLDHPLRRAAIERILFEANRDEVPLFMRMLAEDALAEARFADALRYAQDAQLKSDHDVALSLVRALAASQLPEEKSAQMSAFSALIKNTADVGMADAIHVLGALMAHQGHGVLNVDAARERAMQAFMHSEGLLDVWRGTRSAMLRERALLASDAVAVELERDAILTSVEERDGRPALDALRELVSEDPSDFGAWDALRVAAREAGAWADVVQASVVLADALTGELRGQLLEEAGIVAADRLFDEVRAEECLRNALAEKPLRTLALSRLRAMFSERNDVDALQSLVEEATERTDDATELAALFYELAQLHRASGATQERLAALENALMLDSHHVGSLALAVETYVALGRFEDAVQTLEALSQSDLPATERRVARLGAADLLEQKLADPARALLQLQSLGKDGLADYASWMRTAKLAASLGKDDVAVDAWTCAKEIAAPQKQPDAMVELARHYIARHQTPRAVALLEQALTLDPTHIGAAQLLRSASATSQPTPVALRGVFERAFDEAHEAPTDVTRLRTLRQAALLRRDRTIELVSLQALVALGAANAEEERAASRLRTVLGLATPLAVSDSDASAILKDVPQVVHVLALLASAYARVEPWDETSQITPPHAGTEERAFFEARKTFAASVGIASWIARPFDAAWLGLVAAACATDRELRAGDRAYAQDPFVRALVSALSAQERDAIGAAMREIPNEQTLLEAALRVHAACDVAAALALIDVVPAVASIASRAPKSDSSESSELVRRALAFWIGDAPSILRGKGKGA